MVESRHWLNRHVKPGWFFNGIIDRIWRKELALEAVNISEQQEQPLEETVVKIFRCAKVVKGGRRFSFAALVVLGDRSGTVGIGYGKANEVPLAVEKGIKDAKKTLNKINLLDRTIPHQVIGRFGGTKIIIIPASPGTGVIAGGSARAVLELSGVQDVLTKVVGSTTAKNVVKATMDGLLKLRSKEMVESLRGVEVEAVKRW
jgi:small subunit ribosomal protein S5